MFVVIVVNIVVTIVVVISMVMAMDIAMVNNNSSVCFQTKCVSQQNRSSVWSLLWSTTKQRTLTTTF